MGVLFSNFEAKAELSVSVESFVGVDLELEAEQIVGVGEICLAGLRQLQLGNILTSRFRSLGTFSNSAKYRCVLKFSIRRGENIV